MLYTCTHVATVGVSGLIDLRSIRPTAIRPNNELAPLANQLAPG